VLVLVGDVKGVHGLDHGLHGREDVLVDQPGEVPLVLVRVPGAVDDPHLLDESALPTLPSSYSQPADNRHDESTTASEPLSTSLSIGASSPRRRRRRLHAGVPSRSSWFCLPGLGV